MVTWEPDQKRAFARVFTELWPKLTDEQLRECGRYLQERTTSDTAIEALRRMYRDGHKYAPRPIEVLAECRSIEGPRYDSMPVRDAMTWVEFKAAVMEGRIDVPPEKLKALEEILS